MIDYEIRYLCDYPDCTTEYKTTTVRWYYRTEAMFPMIPTEWKVLVIEGSSTLYCPDHNIDVGQFTF